MKIKQSEDSFQSQLIELAHTFGWYCAHFRPAKTEKGWRTSVSADGKGFPDLVLARDRVLFIECKSEAGVMSKDQLYWRHVLLQSGAEYYEWKPDMWHDIVKILSR